MGGHPVLLRARQALGLGCGVLVWHCKEILLLQPNQLGFRV